MYDKINVPWTLIKYFNQKYALLRLGNRKHMDIQDIHFSHSESLFFLPVRSVEDPGFWPGLFQSCSTDLKQELNR